tara:strand:- start:149 stop:574 length:426 start_codon:yes stop_codon:yes gene_type:complete
MEVNAILWLILFVFGALTIGFIIWAFTRPDDKSYGFDDFAEYFSWFLAVLFVCLLIACICVQGTWYKRGEIAKLYNEEYGTEYTQHDYFWRKNIIDKFMDDLRYNRGANLKAKIEKEKIFYFFKTLRETDDEHKYNFKVQF